MWSAWATCGDFHTSATRMVEVNHTASEPRADSTELNPSYVHSSLFTTQGPFWCRMVCSLWCVGFLCSYWRAPLVSTPRKDSSPPGGNYVRWPKVSLYKRHIFYMILKPQKIHDFVSGSSRYEQTVEKITFSFGISGIGYGQAVVKLYDFSFIIIEAWALFYLVFSFSAQAPWATCENSWNTGQISFLKLENAEL